MSGTFAFKIIGVVVGIGTMIFGLKKIAEKPEQINQTTNNTKPNTNVLIDGTGTWQSTNTLENPNQTVAVNANTTPIVKIDAPGLESQDDKAVFLNNIIDQLSTEPEGIKGVTLVADGKTVYFLDKAGAYTDWVTYSDDARALLMKEIVLVFAEENDPNLVSIKVWLAGYNNKYWALISGINPLNFQDMTTLANYIFSFFSQVA